MPYFVFIFFVFFTLPGLASETNLPDLKAKHVLVLDDEGKILLSKKPDTPTPIASITKLMTAMVVLDAKQDLSQKLTITEADRDTVKHSHSRLKYGASLSRKEMLKIALSASENRAAHVLSRYYPGGESACVKAMNAKAKALGMSSTRFRDPTGLNPGNISTAHDLALMVNAAMEYRFIRKATTTKKTYVRPFKKGKPMEYWTTNRFLRSGNWRWKIYLSKTGYIKEAGRCLVMRAKTADKTMTIVLLNAFGKLTPYGDSNRIRKWLGGNEHDHRMAVWAH